MLESVTDALKRGEPAEALALARSVVAERPNDVDALHALAIAQQANRQSTQARATLDQALALAPQRSELFVTSAHLALGTRDVDSAVTGFKRSIELDPNQLLAYVMLGQLALARGDLEEADKQLGLARLVAPDHPHVLLNEAGLAQARGDVDSAIRALSRAVEMVPRDPGVLAGLGMAYLQKGLFSFAAETFARALERKPDARHLRWARVQALRKGGLHREALEEAERLQSEDPNDLGAQALVADTLFSVGRSADAMAAYRRMLERDDAGRPVMSVVLRALLARDARAQAVELLEQLLEADPQRDLIWQARFELDAADPARSAEVAARWLQAMPGSAQANELEALRLEAAGELAEAERYADAALSADPARSMVQLVKMRAELHREPGAALKRLDVLAAGTGQPEARRMLLGWRGLALERLERHAEALAAWREMETFPAARRPLPVVAEAGEPAAGIDGLSPLVLWGPPGARPERVMLLLRGQPDFAMLDDRFGPGPRPDGFGFGESQDGGPAASDAAPPDLRRWASSIERVGLEPGKVIDWFPHFDASLDAALPGNRLVAVVRDPRDMLLDWWVFGCAQRYRFPGVEAAADWLRAVLEMLVARRSQDPGKVVLVHVDRLQDDRSAVQGSLADFLSLDAPPAADAGPDPSRGPGGHRNGFEAGHWKRYEDELQAAFTRLEPVARELGY